MYICSSPFPVPGIEARTPTSSPLAELRQTSTVAHNNGELSSVLA